MIRLITTLVISIFLFSTSLFSQDLTGSWYGKLIIGTQNIRINFHVSEENGIFTTLMDSPDQGAKNVPTTKTTVTKNEITVILDALKVKYKGTLKDGTITGTFTQASRAIPLLLTHNIIEAAPKKLRPQVPKKPYNYKSKEVTFTNPKAANIKLAGTLTLPNNVKNPAVAILISGSGPQNRNSELKAFNHQPFLILSDYLTNNGIAVLRYDDRGVGQSEGKQQGATSADFATDVEAAVAFLKTRKDINTKKIGLIGHSEGGFIAPMVASRNKKIAFIVLLSGTGVDGGLILRTQERKANELKGVQLDVLDFNEKFAQKLHNIVKKSKDKETLKTDLESFITNFKETDTSPYAKALTYKMTNQIVHSLSNEWLTYFIKTDPKQFLCKVKSPVLALNGSKDFQVLPKLNLNGIKRNLKKSKDVTIMELEGLNHLFQTCQTGSLEEYGKIEETFSPKALKLITNWINKRF